MLSSMLVLVRENLPLSKGVTVLVEHLKGCFHCVDVEFSLFDALFHALFDGGIFKTKFCIFLKI